MVLENESIIEQLRRELSEQCAREAELAQSDHDLDRWADVTELATSDPAGDLKTLAAQQVGLGASTQLMSKELAALRVQLLSQEEKAAAAEDVAMQSAHEIAQLKRDYETTLLASKVLLCLSHHSYERLLRKKLPRPIAQR